MAASPLTRLVDYLRMCAGRAHTQAAPDEQLLMRFVQHRDDSAFDALVRRHAALVWNVCRRVLSNEQDIEDAFQATFFVLFRKAGSIRNRVAVTTWLYGVAYRIALKARATGQRHGSLPLQDMPRTQADALSEASGLEVQTIVDEEIAQLPERFRAVLVLCVLGGQSQAEAARQLGVKEKTVASRLARARQRLRGRLARRGVLVAAGGCGVELVGKPGVAMAGTLVAATLRMARLMAAGEAAASTGISTGAVALAESFLVGAMLTKVKVGLFLALLSCAFAGGVGWAAHRVWVSEPASAKRDEGRSIKVHPADPAGKQKKDAAQEKDINGDPLPAGAIARLGQDRWLHGITTNFAAILPDGKTVVTVNSDRTIRRWEFPSGKQIDQSTLGLTPTLTPMARGGPPVFNPRLTATLTRAGKVVAVAWGSEIYFYDAATFKELREPIKLPQPKDPPQKQQALGFNDAVQELAFSPGGEQLACLNDMGNLSIWDWAKAKQVSTIPIGSNEFTPNYRVLFAPDGKTLATVNMQLFPNPALVVKFWDPAKAHLLLETSIKIDGAMALAMAFSRDSKTLAFTTRSSITLVEAATGKQSAIAKAVGKSAPTGFRGVAFGKDGTKLYTFETAKVTEWELATGEMLSTCAAGSGYGTKISLSPDGNTLVLNGHGPRFFDVSGRKDITPVNHVSAPLHWLQFLPDGKSVQSRSGGGAGELLQKWDAVTGKNLGRVNLVSVAYSARDLFGDIIGGVSETNVSPDGKVVATLGDFQPTTEKPGTSKVNLIDASTGKEMSQIPLQESEFKVRLCFSPDSKTLAISQPKKLKIELYEIATKKLVRPLNAVLPAIANPQGGGGGGGKPTYQQNMLFAGDGKTLAWFDNRNPVTVAFFDTATGKQIGSLPMPQDPKNAVAGGGLAVTGFGSSAGERVAFSPDGRCLAGDMKDGTAVLYELATAQRRSTFGEKQAPPREIKGPVPDFVPFGGETTPTCFAFSPDGRSFAQSGPNGVIRLWDIVTGQQLQAFQGHVEGVNAIAFAPDGKTVASASDDSTVLIWDVSRIKRPVMPVKTLTPAGLEACWEALTDKDAINAFAKMRDLVAAPKDAVPFLKDRVKPAAPLDVKRVEQLIKQLDHAQFKLRGEANIALLKIGREIVPTLDQALAADPPLEFKQRLEVLREKLTDMLLQGEHLRAHRAIEVLELIGTPQARQVLRVLADGADGALITTSAKAALKR